MNQKIYRIINIFFLIMLVFLLNIIIQEKENESENDYGAIINETTNSILVKVKCSVFIGKYFSDKENIEYVSCNESIAKVSDQGKITGVSVGKTNIIVKQIKDEEEKILKNYVVVVNKIKIKNRNSYFSWSGEVSKNKNKFI